MSEMLRGNRDIINLVETDPAAAVQLHKEMQAEKAAIKAGKLNDTSLGLAKKFIDKRKMSIKDFAEGVGVSRPLMSQYLNCKYSSDTKDIEKKIMDYLKKAGYIGDDVSLSNEFKTPVFLPSEDALNILGICRSCQEQGALGVIVGQSGFGKTYPLRKYAANDRVAYVECDDGMGTKDMVEALERAVGIPLGFTTIWKRVDALKEFFKVNRGYLLIIDEADKLVSKNTQKKAEIIRAIFDQSPVGVIMAGEPALEGRVKGYIPRLANRVDFYYKLHGVSKAEVREYLGDMEFTTEAFEEMYKRAVNSYTGCFRLLDRTVKNITRILDNSEEKDAVVTLDIIGKASSMMML